MNTTKNSKILLLIIGILLITDIAVIALLLQGRFADSHKNYKSPMTAYLQNEIKFTDAQMKFYEALKITHSASMKKFFDTLRAEKTVVYKQLGGNAFNDSAMQFAVINASNQQLSMEAMMLNHVKNIRAICRPAQQLVFDTGFYKVMVRGRRDSSKNKK